MPSLDPNVRQMVADALERYAETRGERRLIPRGAEKIPYLYRSFLDGKQAVDGEPGLFLHKFVASDPLNQLHNHPWKWSVSFILDGTYRETRTTPFREYEDGTIKFNPPKTVDHGPGSINLISDIDYHRVTLITPYVWTLFLHGPRTGVWGHAEENYDKPVKPTIVTKRTFDVRDKVTKAVR